jgi:kynurenine formamidase
MKWLTFTFAAALAIALFLFLQRRPAESAEAAGSQAQQSPQFRNVMDLTAPSGRTGSSLNFTTRIVAPSRYVPRSWTVDDIPPQRLIGTLVVLDVRAEAASHPDYEISVDDIDHWERVHGEIPPDGIVVALTGRTAPDRSGNFPVYSNDAAEFLAVGRRVLALGTDAPAATHDQLAAELLARNGMYELSGVSGLNMAPEFGAVAVVAPARSSGASVSDARMLALLR